MKITKAMRNAAKDSGGKVQPIRKPQPAPKPKPAPETPKSENSGELKALRDEISELRGLLKQSEITAQQRIQELSAIITAMSTDKPIRVKPVRDLDPKSKTYLLVEHYDFVPVSYRKLDS